MYMYNDFLILVLSNHQLNKKDIVTNYVIKNPT